tara:strand:- start:516 stop:710 length:195 start_codon:yes stop_codon:yes gene_type:complete
MTIEQEMELEELKFYKEMYHKLHKEKIELKDEVKELSEKLRSSELKSDHNENMFNYYRDLYFAR